uniref:Uncharacterized protein n=2 Tax=Rhizophora mucronata TaxID=61149 RepID=A0A2P2JTM5_RHIMU
MGGLERGKTVQETELIFIFRFFKSLSGSFLADSSHSYDFLSLTSLPFFSSPQDTKTVVFTYNQTHVLPINTRACFSLSHKGRERRERNLEFEEVLGVGGSVKIQIKN